MTKDRPILFSTPMVQAILDGRKTQTRRTRGLEEINKNPDSWKKGATTQTCRFWDADKEEDPNPIDIHYGFRFNGNGNHELYIPCPYGKPGDRLWVRETWQITYFLHPSDENYGYIYKASENGKDWQENTEEWKWKPSIHMPKAAARIWLEITDISVERLQDISKEDAIAEGIEPVADGYKNYMPKLSSTSQFCWPTAYHSFQSLWESINGAESWDRSPWLWVVKFKVLSTTGHPHTPNP